LARPASAVVAELEGHGETTVLTPALLEAFAIQWSGEQKHGRPLHLRALIDAVYALRPIELARFAPLVVAHRSDPVAAKLIAEAERYLVTDFAVIFDAEMPGPIALGGGVMPHLTGAASGIAEIVRAAGHVPDIHLVADGGVGAVVLAMRTMGITVDEAMFRSIAASVSERRGRVSSLGLV
jgi:glucosamine kinase